MTLDIRKKILLDVKAQGTGEAQREFQNLDRSIGAVSLDLDKALASSNSFASGVKRAATEALDGFGRIGGGISTALGGIDKLAKAMGPWNQAIELGGKLVNGATVAMDAYAKTSDVAAREVAKLKKEFEGYRDSILEGTGRIAVALLKPAFAYDEQSKALLRLANQPAFKLLYGANGKSGGLLTGGRYGDQVSDEFKQAAKRFGVAIGDDPKQPIDSLLEAFDGLRDGVKESLHDAADHWNTDGRRFVEGVEKGLGDLGKTAKKASGEVRLAWGDIAKLGGTDTAGPLLGFSTSLGQAAGSADTDYRSTMESALQRNRSLMTDEWKSQIPSFGTDQIKDEMEALQEFTDLSAEAFATIASGSASAGQALKSMAQQMLISFGKKELVEAISETALGFGALANPLFAGAAALHFKSAALHGAAAAAAGVAAAAVGGLGGGGSASASSSSARSASASGGSYAGPQQQGTGERVIVVLGDSFGHNSPRLMQLEAERTVDLAFGATGVTNR